MGAATTIVAVIPAYLVGGIALLFGASWEMALMALIATGLGVILLLAGRRFFVRRGAPDAQAPDAEAVTAS